MAPAEGDSLRRFLFILLIFTLSIQSIVQGLVGYTCEDLFYLQPSFTVENSCENWNKSELSSEIPDILKNQYGGPSRKHRKPSKRKRGKRPWARFTEHR